MFDKRKDINEEGDPAPYEAGPAEGKQARVNTTGSGRTAVIGPKIRINGDVSGDENLLVEGKVDGKLSMGQHRVDIGPTGEVKADIEAKVVKVDGEVKGDVTGSEKVIISSHGNVHGNIVSPRVSLDDGAKFKGSIDMDPGKLPAKPEKPAAAKSAPGSSSSGNGVSASTDAGKSSDNGQGPIGDKPKPKPKGEGRLSLKAD